MQHVENKMKRAPHNQRTIVYAAIQRSVTLHLFFAVYKQNEWGKKERQLLADYYCHVATGYGDSTTNQLARDSPGLLHTSDVN